MPDILIPSFLPRETGTSFQPSLSGTVRVSQVLVYFSSYMPRPDDTGRPSGISPVQCQSKPCGETDDSVVLASVTLKTSPSALILLTVLYHASEVAFPPVAYMILCVRFVWVVQRFVYPSQSRNTQYGWLAKPYPAGTFTLQEAPSFTWRTIVEFHDDFLRNVADFEKNIVRSALINPPLREVTPDSMRKT